MLCTFSPFKNSNPASIPNIPPLPGLLSQEAPLLLRGVCVCAHARALGEVCPLSFNPSVLRGYSLLQVRRGTC